MELIYQSITLEIIVRSEEFAGAYDQMEVWRSTDGSVYEELTAENWSPARLPANAGLLPDVPVTGPSIFITGKTLQLEVNGQQSAQLGFSFVGNDPRTLADVALQLTLHGAPYIRAYVSTEQRLVIETVYKSSNILLHVIPNDAASILALPLELPDSLARGKDARIALIQNVNTYRYTDTFGVPGALYKTRFRNSFSNVTSEFGQPFTSESTIGVSSSALVVGYVALVDNEGKFLVGREVSVRSPFNGTLVGSAGKLVVGNDVMRRTDVAGRVEFTLVRGQRYTLSIAGTTLVKDVTAPTDPAISIFNMVDPAFSEQPDYFKARVPDIPIAERRGI